jgi:hypothetical protein
MLPEIRAIEYSPKYQERKKLWTENEEEGYR